MKIWHSLVITVACSEALLNCSKSGHTGANDSANPPPAAISSPNGPTVTVGGQTINMSVSADYWPSGYWLGYDGTTTFSTLLAGGRGAATYTVADPSIASITPLTVTIDQSTHDTLWSACQKINPSANSQIFERRYAVGTTITSYKLTALKVGQTYLTQSVKAGSGFGGGRGGQATPRVIFVTEYAANAVATGKARYNNAPSIATATNLPCGPACHGDAAHGAPNHALGQVETIPDVAVAQWIEKGSLPYINLNAQTDKGISHAWTFASPDEEKGVIAYLRTLQADNFEELLTLEFQGDAQAAQICSMTSPPGVGPVTPATTPGSGT